MADTVRIRQAIFWLDQIEQAGLTLQFNEALQQAYIDERQRRNRSTINDRIRAGTLAHRVAKLLEEDERTCRELAQDYTCGAGTKAAIDTMRQFAEQAKRILRGGPLS